jgi:glycosyltransferase involved in cell wall biosynthesis
MKVLHVIDSEGFYGAETVLINLVAEQKRQGIEATIVNMRHCDPAEKSLESEAGRQGLIFTVIPLRAGLDIVGAWEILKYAKQKRFDIIHCHGYKPNILLGLMLKAARNIPMVSTLHGWTSTSNFSKIRLFEQLDLFSLRFMNAVVVVTEAMKHHPRLKKKHLQLQVVNNGIPQIDFDSSLLDEEIKDFCSRDFVIGAIGRLSKEKGFEYLIEALKLLTAQGIKARLLIMGEGPERSFLEGIVEKYHLQQKILMPGFRENAGNYIPLFRVFVLSSLTEGLPITLLEAMQAKVPVIATSVGGIPEVLEEGAAGILVQPGSATALAEGIIHIRADRHNTHKLAEHAYARVVSKYNSGTMALGYLQLYERVKHG